MNKTNTFYFLISFLFIFAASDSIYSQTDDRVSAGIKSESDIETEPILAALGSQSKLALESLQKNDLSQANQLADKNLGIIESLNEESQWLDKDIINDIQQIFSRLGRFDAITSTYEKIVSIMQPNMEKDLDRFLAVLTDFADWRLLAVNIDDRSNRINHIVQAEALYKQALDLGEIYYDEDSIKLAPLNYNVALMRFRIGALANSSELAGAIRAIYESNLSHPLYGQNTYNYIRRIQDIVAQSSNIEHQAMAALYVADWAQIYNSSMAPRRYRQAWDLLVKAGYSNKDIQQLFSTSLVLPVQELYLTMDGAANGYYRKCTRELPSDEEYPSLVQFVGWGSPLYKVQTPNSVAFYEGSIEDSTSDVILRSKLLRRGRVSKTKAVFTYRDLGKDTADAKRAVEANIYRPHIVDKKVKPLEEFNVRYCVTYQ